MSKVIEYNTQLSLINYFSLVDDISSRYFDDNGEYQPHIGRLYALIYFYDNCVGQNEYIEEYEKSIKEIDSEDIPQEDKVGKKNNCYLKTMEKIASDPDVVGAFNKVLESEPETELDFTNAYYNALEIVEAKRDSFGNILEGIRGVIESIVEKINPVISNEGLPDLLKMAKSVSGNEETIVDRIINQITGENNKIVPFDKGE